MKYLFIVLLILFGVSAFAQDMNIGFKQLERGNFKEAEHFFGAILKSYPDNKTAKLCYGRAMGLSGNPSEAKSIFSVLLEIYPNDFELQLNYAESLLWNSEYETAASYYVHLIEVQPESFTARLGYANTLSNLKNYEQALIEVNKALNIKKNDNALKSRKYIRLGLATILASSENYEDAEELLLQNINENPNDLDSALSLANIYLIQNKLHKADEVYSKLYDSTQVYMGKSLVAHKNNQEKKALQFAEQAVAFNINADTALHYKVKERYVQALIWNGKYKNAKEEIITIKKEFGSIASEALQAMLGMYNSNFTISEKSYRNILEADSTSFDGNLGIANMYRAKGELTKAFQYAQSTLLFYPNQKDAKRLLNTIENELSPKAFTQALFTKDNGGNEAYAYQIHLTIPLLERIKFLIGFNNRNTKNATLNSRATHTNLSAGLQLRLKGNTWIESHASVGTVDTDNNTYDQVNGELFITSRPFPNHYIKAGFKKELQDFNSQLLSERISLNNYILNYNLGTNFGLGWYTGYTFTTQSDNNNRNLLFSSLYYNFSKKPQIKGGINYQFLGFKQQVPELYFSPSNYQAIELFSEVSGNYKDFSYYLLGAAGYQFVENDTKTSLLRGEIKLKYAISKRSNLELYGKYSNIASETATGFQFSEVGLKWVWQITKKPIFKIN